MWLTSKSPKTILFAAYRVAQQALPTHHRIEGPKKFAQHQLFTCLVLKAMLKSTAAAYAAR